MPFIESIADMDRLRQKRTQGAPEAARVPGVSLAACDSLEAAQSALLAVLWTDPDKCRRPSATYRRLLRYANRLTLDVDKALDLLMGAVCNALQHWQDVTDLTGYLWEGVRRYGYAALRKQAREVTPNVDVADVADMEPRTYCDIDGKQYRDDRYNAARATLCWLYRHICQGEDERRVVRYALAWRDDEAIGYGRIALYPDLDAIGREMKISGTQVARIAKRIGVRAGVWLSERKLRNLRPSAMRHGAYVSDSTVWPISQLIDLWDVDFNALARAAAIETTCDMIVRACTESARLLPPMPEELAGMSFAALERAHTGY